MPTAESAIRASMWPALARSHGVSVQYRRNGANVGTPFVVVKGRSQTEIVNSGVMESAIGDDWITRREDLVARGITSAERGDRITWTDSANVTRSYEVQQPAGDRGWSKVDQFGLLVRIHSKEIFA